jgi:hypothetical protein
MAHAQVIERERVLRVPNRQGSPLFFSTTESGKEPNGWRNEPASLSPRTVGPKFWWNITTAVRTTFFMRVSSWTRSIKAP